MQAIGSITSTGVAQYRRPARQNGALTSLSQRRQSLVRKLTK